jgi:hypothetical protein
MPDHHKFHNNLPRNTKEFMLFMGVVSIISVNIIAPLITFSELGFSPEIYIATLKILPLLWICVIPTVLITKKPATHLTNKVAKQGDSFSSTIMINTLFSVFCMSIVLTIVGTWIGTHHVSLEPFEQFFMKWPRNFGIAFAVEALIAQPIARFVMYELHRRKKSLVPKAMPKKN